MLVMALVMFSIVDFVAFMPKIIWDIAMAG